MEQLKEYTLKDVEQRIDNYRLIKMVDFNENEVFPFNQPTLSAKDQFKRITKRFNSDMIPDGYYFIYCCISTRRSKNPDKFLIKKGNPQQPTDKTVTIQRPNELSKNEIISVTAALDYITQIATLKNEITRLELENKQLKEECAELSSELEELQDGEGLSEDKSANTVTEYLKETAPTLIALADRYFNLQEKKIQLEANKQTFKRIAPKKPINKETLKIGSAEHIELIKKLYNESNTEALDKELDKLEQQNPEQYEILCNELNLFFEDENE